MPSISFQTCLTVNKEYYVEVLREFRKRFLGKRPAIKSNGPLYMDDARASRPVRTYINAAQTLNTI